MRPKRVVALLYCKKNWLAMTRLQMMIWDYDVVAMQGPEAGLWALRLAQMKKVHVVLCERPMAKWKNSLNQLPETVGLVVEYAAASQAEKYSTLTRAVNLIPKVVPMKPLAVPMRPLAVRLREKLKVLSSRRRGPKPAPDAGIN